MLSDRERQELAGIERRLLAEDPDATGPPVAPPAPQPDPRLRAPVLTTVLAAVLLLACVLLLGIGQTLVLGLVIAAVSWGLSHWRRSGWDRRPEDGS